jgi:3-oxoacyl-[acyl-carrier protein] reductase
LAGEGAKVGVLDIDEGAARLTAELADGLGVAADVSDPAAVDAALATVEAELGPVDIWVNNAGISGGPHKERVGERAERRLVEQPRPPLDALVRLTDDEWRRMLAVHLDGTFHGTRAAARSMVAHGGGTIVNVASICGIEGCVGHPHYSAAKGGILAFTRAVAKELIEQGVRVNAVAPGFIETPMTASTAASITGAIEAATPAGRMGTAAEVAATVAFLAGPDAGFYVGATLSPNGGFVTV